MRADSGLSYRPRFFLSTGQRAWHSSLGIGGSEFEAFTALLVLHSDLVDAPDHLGKLVCADPEDDKFLACALAAGAEIIVSGDKQLLDVTGWRGIEVLRPRTFVEKYLSDLQGGAS
jgi:predicted nucleic acid-binding protein